MKTFMKHQLEAFEYAKPLSRIALFMEMRLGKTLVAIRWSEFNECRRTLSVSPKSVVPVWQEELLDEEYAEEDIITLKGTAEQRLKKAQAKEPAWFLINYESLLNSPEILFLPWDCIILDESTRIRRSRAEITKLLNRHSDHIKLRAILSGHPCPESEIDYYEQMKFLFGNFMRKHNIWHWMQHYCLKLGFDWQVKKSFLPAIKEAVSDRAFVMTRKQAGLGSKKIYERLFVEMESKQRKIYDKIMKDFEYGVGKERRTTKWATVKHEWLSSVASGFTPDGELLSLGKYKLLLDKLKTDFEGEKVVVWFRHNHELEFADSWLRKNKIKTAMYKGNIKEDKKFKEGNAQVLLAQGKVGMMGLNWAVSSTMIYFSNWHDGEIRFQTEDRIIDVKRKEPLLYLDLITEDSIDEDVLLALKDKKLVGRYFTLKLSELLLKSYKWRRK